MSGSGKDNKNTNIYIKKSSHLSQTNIRRIWADSNSSSGSSSSNSNNSKHNSSGSSSNNSNK